MPYAWGSRDSISTLCAGGSACLGDTASPGSPEAELWLGDHPISPSKFVNEHLGCSNLLEFTSLFMDAKPNGFTDAKCNGLLPPLPLQAGKLPFLMKIIAARVPLSLQLHPPLKFAQKGYEREEKSGVPISDPNRSYKDPNHKPEMLCALEDGFCAAAGLLPRDQAACVVEDIISFIQSADKERPAKNPFYEALSFFEPLVSKITNGSKLIEILQYCLKDQCAPMEASLSALAAWCKSDNSKFPLLKQTISSVLEHFPQDRGVFCVLLLQQIYLKKGECIYIPPGTLHAYIRGLGIEVMASSDNVLRAGITHKHINLPEILEILRDTDFPAGSNPEQLRCVPVSRAYQTGSVTGAACRIFVNEYRPVCGSFLLAHIYCPKSADKTNSSDMSDRGDKSADAPQDRSDKMAQVECVSSKHALAPGFPVLSAPAIVFCAQGGATIRSKSNIPAGIKAKGKKVDPKAYSKTDLKVDPKTYPKTDPTCEISGTSEISEISETSANMRRGDAVFITNEFVVEPDQQGCILFSVSC